MNRRKHSIFGAALLVTVATGSSAALAQTFQNYRCADGTQFIAGFFKYDSRAFLQIDGQAVTLARRPSLSGASYSGGGIALRIGKAGVTLRHARRPATACELT
jgi:membrane-bound inhibitor of C-type lysozyme